LTNEQSSNKGFEMAMGTDNTALTRASRKLKELASDTISIPTTAELCDRKSAELADARQALDAIIQRQRELEKDKNRPGSATDSVRAEKEKQLASVARLENESATLEAARQAEKPAPALTPRQQVRADFFNGLAFDPYAKARRGSPEKIAAAQQAVDELVREYRLTQPSGNARETMTAKLNAARLRLTALEGPPYPPYMPWASRETLAAARKAEGLE
jgi:hypothetical protein